MPELVEIALRKQRLIARSAAQRVEIAVAFQALERPFSYADRVVSMGRTLRAHPVLLGAVVAALVAMRRRSTFGLVARAVAAWRVWRQASLWAQRLGMADRWRRRREKTGHVAT